VEIKILLIEDNPADARLIKEASRILMTISIWIGRKGFQRGLHFWKRLMWMQFWWI
jgi:hypothetical protein